MVSAPKPQPRWSDSASFLKARLAERLISFPDWVEDPEVHGHVNRRAKERRIPDEAIRKCIYFGRFAGGYRTEVFDDGTRYHEFKLLYTGARNEDPQCFSIVIKLSENLEDPVLLKTVIREQCK